VCGRRGLDVALTTVCALSEAQFVSANNASQWSAKEREETVG